MIVGVVHTKEFGNDRFYPQEMDVVSSSILELMGRKSFTHDQIKKLMKAGFKVIIVSKQDPDFFLKD